MRGKTSQSSYNQAQIVAKNPPVSALAAGLPSVSADRTHIVMAAHMIILIPKLLIVFGYCKQQLQARWLTVMSSLPLNPHLHKL